MYLSHGVLVPFTKVCLTFLLVLEIDYNTEGKATLSLLGGRGDKYHKFFFLVLSSHSKYIFWLFAGFFVLVFFFLMNLSSVDIFVLIARTCQHISQNVKIRLINLFCHI